MNKSTAIVRAVVSDYLTYRANFLFWRFRNLISYLSLIVFWQALFQHSDQVFSYSEKEMMTYILGIAFISNGILGSLVGSIAGQIRSGEITRDLMYPWNIFWMLFLRDLVDKSFNIIFLIPEAILLIAFFHITIVFPSSLLTIGVFFVFLLSALFLFFFLNLFLSLTAFWTDDVWAVRWLFGVILFDFFSGLYFPLDILPAWLFRIISFTPFPYVAYFPMKLWLGDLSIAQGVQAIAVTSLWGIIFYFATRKLFNWGIKDYGAYGN